MFIVKNIAEKILKYVNRSMLYISVFFSVLILIHNGFDSKNQVINYLHNSVVLAFYVLTALLVFRVVLKFMVDKRALFKSFGDFVTLFYFLIFSYVHVVSVIKFLDVLLINEWLYVGVFLLAVVEISRNFLFFDKYYFNPTMLFVLSFLGLVLLGTIFLMLPKVSSHQPLGFINALFMSTSSVCITGLTTVNVGTDLTHFGKIIIIILSQIGGLGIMTFTGFFGYFFTGMFSYKNHLMFSEFLGENKMSAVIKTLFKIIFITFFFEIIVAFLIYSSVSSSHFSNHYDHLFFSVFHAISSFCNAGFTTLPDGLEKSSLRFNYSFQIVLAVSFILGGLGYIIVLNTYTYIKTKIIDLFSFVFRRNAMISRPWLMSFNTRFIFYISMLLVVVGTLGVFVLEYSGALQEHTSFFGKLSTAFFTGTTPRSAGLSVIPITSLSMPAVLFIILLMYIGASPGSTGGGIKNTTFAVAFLNTVNIIRGKERLEILGRQIAPESVQKAFAILFLSILYLGLTIFLLCITDPLIDFKSIVFEAFSAFSTVGLSLGITHQLSSAGKIVIVFAMFVGRVGMFTILVSMVKKAKSNNYQYPEEEIMF